MSRASKISKDPKLIKPEPTSLDGLQRSPGWVTWRLGENGGKHQNDKEKDGGMYGTFARGAIPRI
jgi:hypothetical protein